MGVGDEKGPGRWKAITPTLVGIKRQGCGDNPSLI